eukprot:537174-Amphidinium_carterae.8
MQVDIELNNFLYFAELCHRAGAQQPNNSPNNATNGWKRLTGMSQKWTRNHHRPGENCHSHQYRPCENRHSHQSLPKTTWKAHDVESQQHYDFHRGSSMVVHFPFSATRDYNHKGPGKDKGKGTITCYTCGKTGHYSSQCYQNTKKGTKDPKVNHTNTTAKVNSNRATNNNHAMEEKEKELENRGTRITASSQLNTTVATINTTA